MIATALVTCGARRSLIRSRVGHLTAWLVCFSCATVSVGEAITPAVPLVARPLPLTAVRLTGGPLKRAQDLDAAYLLELEPDRMLAHYRRLAGLEPKGRGYGGWDANGRQLTGHIAGHYLSAASLMWAATGDERLKERVDYIVRELKEVQDAHGDGFVGALENCKERFAELAQGDIRSSGFDLNGLWSPWYTLHKTYAGLRDAYRYTGNKTALELEIKFAEWTEGILSRLNEAQIQQMLNTEFGGMNEVLVDLYADTGDPRWLKLSYKFEHRAIIEPLQHRQDILAGKHGNTQVPKLIGSLVRYRYVGDERDGQAARFFWDQVAEHHSFATGGHGKDEYFGPPDKLDDRIDGRTAETCNVYNMLKLTRMLFALRPDPRYAEFHERALFNHILASIDPEDGRTCYMVPVGQGVQREYQQMFRSFTCCVGTGMESHALHGDGIYFESGDKLWVNLYAPSTVQWQAAGVTLVMESELTEGDNATVTLTLESPRQFTLALRRPAWAGDGFAVAVNGGQVSDLAQPGAYQELMRTWQSGDVVSLTLPKRLQLEPLPDNPSRVAILWGPLVLAGDLGPESERGFGRGRRGPAQAADGIPVFVVAEKPLDEWLRPADDVPGNFHTDGVGRERDVDFMPFYRLHRRVYGGYWDLFTPSQWEERAAEFAAQREQQRQLELATVAYAQPGEMQPERDFNFQGEQTWPVRDAGRAGRVGRGWFSFDMPVESARPMVLMVTYRGGERRREAKFEIQIDGQTIAEETLRSGTPARFYDASYPVPEELVGGKERLTVRFQAKEQSGIGPVFGVRMVRHDAGQ